LLAAASGDCREIRPSKWHGAARLGALSSPWTWLGALLVAGALVVLGHTSAEAAGDAAPAEPTDLLASVVAPIAGTLAQVPVPAVDSLVQPVADEPLVRTLSGTAITPLGQTLTAVSGALPAPIGPVAHDVVASLPQAAADAATPPAPAAEALSSPVARPAALAAAPSAAAGRAARPRLAVVTASPAGQATADGTSGGTSPATPTTPWSPGPLPTLPGGTPGPGGLAPLTAGAGATSLAWAAVLTLLLALVVLARARTAAPLALRSATHASRMRRPG
jgi:hypothetical protein